MEVEHSDIGRDIPRLCELISKEWWEKLTLSCPWLLDPIILHRQWGEVQPWGLCLRSQRTHFRELTTDHMSPELQAYTLTSGQSFPPIHNPLYHEKNMKPCCTQGNGEVDCNVPSVLNVIPLGFNDTTGLQKCTISLHFCQEHPRHGRSQLVCLTSQAHSLTAAQIITGLQNSWD